MPSHSVIKEEQIECIDQQGHVNPNPSVPLDLWDSWLVIVDDAGNKHRCRSQQEDQEHDDHVSQEVQVTMSNVICVAVVRDRRCLCSTGQCMNV